MGESFTGLQPLQVQTTQGSRSSCQSKDETLKQLFTRNHFSFCERPSENETPPDPGHFPQQPSSSARVQWLQAHGSFPESDIISSSNHHQIIIESSSDHLLPSIVHPGGHIDSVPPDVVKWFLSADYPRNHFSRRDPNPGLR